MTPTLKTRRKLSKRRNKHQMAKRATKMQARSEWRAQMIDGVNKGFGAVAQVVNNNQRLNDRRQRVNLALIVTMALVIVYLLYRTW